ncbi:hypothetical protein ASPCAL10082 [Aspergillus calidoustus]|uniref:LysM domain-containing protein n=1 Tax=Aspergillus calidoustus TaxID=454130 RepID=A0A0U5G4C7_ASPCI|nr:hypothetical protein ASPCAL10082 [Aspergillus calidoustus]
MPVSTYTSTLLLQPSATTTLPSTSTTNQSPTSTCLGQFVEQTDPELTCFELADTYNVSTGTIVHITGEVDCYFETSICLPLPCDIDRFDGNPTCEDLIARYSMDEFPVSLTQFLAWNPHIQGSFLPAAITNLLQSLQRRPALVNITQPVALNAPEKKQNAASNGSGTLAIPAEPTQTGTTPACGRYYKVVSGDTCNTVALRFGITFADLKLLNTYLRDDCTNLWLEYDICVAPVTEATVSIDAAALQVDIAELVYNIAVLETVFLVHANLIMVPPRMVHVVQIGDSRLAVIQNSALAVQSTGTVEMGQISVAQETAILENASPILEVQVSMESAVQASQGIKHVQELNLGTVAQPQGIVEVRTSTVVLDIVIQEHVRLDTSRTLNMAVRIT